MAYLALYNVKLCRYDYEKKTSIHDEDNGILYVDSFADAATQIEDYYADELETMSIELFDAGFFHFSSEYLPIIKKIINEA